MTAASYIELAERVRELRELSQQWRAHREAFDASLTADQRHQRAIQEARMRAGTLRGKPSCFATLPGELGHD